MSFFQLAWLIPLLPLAAFLIITFFSPFYRTRQISSGIAIGAMLIATLLAWGVAAEGASGGFGAPAAETTSAAPESGSEFTGFGSAYTVSFDWAATGDQ